MNITRRSFLASISFLAAILGLKAEEKISGKKLIPFKADPPLVRINESRVFEFNAIGGICAGQMVALHSSGRVTIAKGSGHIPIGFALNNAADGGMVHIAF